MKNSPHLLPEDNGEKKEISARVINHIATFQPITYSTKIVLWKRLMIITISTALNLYR
jgi:hypothetical protein